MTDAELVGIAREFRAGILDGRPSAMACFMVAWPLAGLLRFHGLDCRLVEGELAIADQTINHFWIALPDGRVLDPTADQFNEAGLGNWPDIYLGQPGELHQPASMAPGGPESAAQAG